MIDLQSYKEKGYLLLKKLIEPREVDLIRSEAKAIFISQMRRFGIVDSGDILEAEFEQGMIRLFETDLQTFMNCGKHAQHLISLHRLSLDERIVALLKELGLDRPSVSTRPVMYFNAERLAKKEVYWRVSPHQDWRSIQGSLDSVVVWVPLVRIDRQLGAIEVMPGSHKRGLMSAAEVEDGFGIISEPLDAAEFVPVEVEKGDALFFSTFLVHRSGTNVTDSIRWSCHFRYNNLSEKTFVQRGLPHPYIYRPVEELITAGFPETAQLDEIFR
jgi:phytanoyl-CoA hydroxylase